MAGIAHEIPLLDTERKLTRPELSWLVQCAIQITKESEAKVKKMKVSAPAATQMVDATLLPTFCELMLKDYARSSSDLGVSGYGPAKAARSLHINVSAQQAWLRNARNMAIAGSCPHSHDQLRSGTRAYAAFAARVGNTKLPPSVDMLLSWSTVFRSSLTFQNYTTSLRTACKLAGIPVEHTYDAVLKKAARAIDKRRGFISRPPMFFGCLLYTSPSPRDGLLSRMPSSA